MDLVCGLWFADPFPRSNWEVKEVGCDVRKTCVFAEYKMQDKHLYVLRDMAALAHPDLLIYANTVCSPSLLCDSRISVLFDSRETKFQLSSRLGLLYGEWQRIGKANILS